MKNTITWVILLGLSGCRTTTSTPLTPPKSTQQYAHFLAIGDWGRRSTAQTNSARTMDSLARTSGAEYIVSVGDNFYETGVKSTTDAQWQTTFEQVYQGASLKTRPWYVVLGNHDYEGNPQAQLDYSGLSSRWNMPARYYTFTKTTPDGTAIRFVALDTSPFIASYKGLGYSDLDQQQTQRQLQWLDSVLTVAEEPWKVVIGHHPIYSAGPHGNEPTLISQVLPLLTKHSVQLYLCGHSHDLQHIQQGATSFVVTGAGTENIGVQLVPNVAYYDGKHTGFADIAISHDSLILRLISSDGLSLYHANYGR